MIDIQCIKTDPDGIIYYYGYNHYSIEYNNKYRHYTVTIEHMDEYGEPTGTVEQMAASELSIAFQIIEEEER